MVKPVVIEEDIYKTVKTGKKKSKTKFEAKDGQQFNTEKEALVHEKDLDRREKFNKIKWLDTDSNYCYLPSEERWYYLSNQEDLDAMFLYIDGYKYCYKYYNGKSFHKDFLKIGEWITLQYEDGGDYQSNLRIYSLSFVSAEMATFVLTFPDRYDEEFS